MKKILLLILLLTLTACSANLPATPSPTKPSTATATPRSTSHVIKYRVRADLGGTASITYQNSSGDTSQLSDAHLPWTEQFSIKDGEFFYVSAQTNNNKSTKLTCDVMVDNEIVKRTDSVGEYVIVTCSGTIGDY